MNQKLLFGLLAAVIVIGGGYYLYRSSSTENVPPPAASGTPPPASPNPDEPVSPPPAPPAATNPATHTIAMTADGFSPANLTIKKGDTVIFRNDDSRDRWPASGVHPVHLLCPGFDALRPLASGETYSHAFPEAKECPMHDHLNPALRGKITVTE